MEPNRTSQRKAIEAWQRLIRGDSHLFRDYPGLLFQQAANQPDRAPPAVRARQRVQEGLSPATWLEWKNKPQQIDPCIMTLADHAEQVWGCAFSPDGHQLATASQDCTLRLWDSATGAPLAVLDGTNMLQGCAFSPDGARVMAVSSFLAKVWDVHTGSEVATLGGEHLWVQGWAYLADGPRIIVKDSNAEGIPVRVWDVGRATEMFTLTGHAFLGVAFAYSPDGHYIVSAEEHQIRIYDGRTGTEIGVSQEIETTMSNCAVSPDGNYVVAGCIDGTLKVWNARTLELTSTLSEHEGSLTACAFSPDSKRVVSASGGWDQRNDLKVWDAQTGSALTMLTGHKDWVRCCAYSPDGRRIASVSNDMTAKIWDATSIEPAPELPAHKSRVSSVQYLPDGGRLASGAGDWTVKLWNTNMGTELATLSKEEKDIGDFALAPDGERVVWASRSEDLIKVWDIETQEQIEAMPALTRAITGMQFLPDGYRFLTIDDDGTIRIWSIDEQSEITNFGQHRGTFTDLCCSPDGRHIVTASGYNDFEEPDESFGELHIWDTQTGDRVASLLTHRDKASCCAYSPDATRLVSGSWDRSLKIWDARNGSELRTLTGHEGAILSCAYSPDGRRIVSSSADWTLRIWCSATGKQLAEFGWLQVAQTCRYSPDGKLILTIPLVGGISWNDAIKVWSATTYGELTSFRPARTVSCFASGSAGRRLALGDEWGRVYLLDLISVESREPIVTAGRLYRGSSGWEERPTARCDWCGKRFATSESVLDAVSETGRKIGSDCSPCEQLPSAAWDDGRLSSQCPNCQKTLRFNPFIVDNRNRY